MKFINAKVVLTHNMEPHNLIPTHKNEILTTLRTNESKKYSERTIDRSCDSITFQSKDSQNML